MTEDELPTKNPSMNAMAFDFIKDLEVWLEESGYSANLEPRIDIDESRYGYGLQIRLAVNFYGLRNP